jgi:DNA helicase-2/ATP-dependent DNA helicase PcrA
MACGDEESIEEERRLLYVAMTRARDGLEINVPLRYHVHRQAFRPSSDRHLYAQVSRFLTTEVRALMDEEHAAAPAGVPLSGAALAADSDDEGGSEDGGGMTAVDQFLSGLWA